MKYGDWTLGQTEALLNKLGGVARAQMVLRGEAEIVVKKNLIDLDANPFVPNGWKVEAHQRGGQFVWNPDEVKLFLPDGQKNGRLIRGDKLRQELQNEQVMNANVLDYLLKNPDLIPENWKGKYVFLWGTIYRGSYGSLCVRYLRWNGGQWFWSSYWLDNAWYDDDPAAVRASS